MDSNLVMGVLVGIIVLSLVLLILRRKGARDDAVTTSSSPQVDATPAVPPHPAPQPAAPPPPPPVAEPAAETDVEPVPPPATTAIGVAAAIGAPDNLLLLKGVGPKLNALLSGLGIIRFDQIAAWNADDIAKVDDHLGAFKGRIERDSWIEQAGLLAKGAIAEFETRFGKLDSEN